jgi:hypothetical protein
MGEVNRYPEISEFLHQLHEYEPRRNMLGYLDTFTDLDFYHIDEIANLGSAEELVRVAGITPRNAAYLLKHVKAKMKREDRARQALA